jgi:hypothetical protein
MLTVDKDEMMMQGKMKIVEKGKGTKIFVIEDVKETVLVGMTEAEMISIEDVLIMTEEMIVKGIGEEIMKDQEIMIDPEIMIDHEITIDQETMIDQGQTEIVTEIAGMNVDTEMIGTADVHLVIPGIGRRMNLEETGEQMIEMPERIRQLVKSVTLQILTE